MPSPHNWLALAGCLWLLTAPVAAFAQEVQAGEGGGELPPEAPPAAPVVEAAPPASPPVPAAQPAPAGPATTSPEAAKAAQEAEEEPYNNVQLQGLNKVTARISTISAPLGTVVRFGNLEIVAHSCWRSPPEDQPENAALLEIWELKPGEGPARIFEGWMFSSSPALSALEHPVYDVTVMACEREKTPEE